MLPTLTNANWQLIYNSNSVLPQVALPGDYNFNGVVDAADYAVWRNDVGQSGVALAADGNGNNLVDSGDYDVWRAHFGQTAGTGAANSSSGAVPEPAAAALFCPAFIALFGLRRIRCAIAA